MTATNHALGGALVATAVSQPVAAIIIAFALHFFMDMLPHFGVAHETTKERNSNRLFRRVLRTDAIMVIMFLAILPFAVNSVSWVLVFVCMLACIGPDFVWTYRYYQEHREGIERDKNRFSRFHSWLQFRESPKGLIFELLWLSAMLWLLVI